jgi:hypothetical protein
VAETFLTFQIVSSLFRRERKVKFSMFNVTEELFKLFDKDKRSEKALKRQPQHQQQKS